MKGPDRSSPGNAPDAEERRRIATDLDVNFVVEAAAGTGKTSSLVTRIVALVRSGKAAMADVAAVTFTKKAAAQLRERVTRRLDEAAREDLPEDERRRLLEARDRLDRAFIGTIHSFCSRLLRERPVEAGIDPEFREADEDTAAVLREEAWVRALERLRADGTAFARLDELGVEPARLRGAYEEICEFPDVVAAHAAVPRPDLSQAVSETMLFLDAMLPTLRSLGRAGTPDDLAAAAWAAHYFRENRRLDDPVSAASFLAILRETSATQKNWPDPVFAKSISDRAKALQRDWIEPALERWYAHCHEPVLRFLAGAAADFRAARLAEGQPGFTDLLLLARDMLRDHETVRGHFRERYPRVLVDEFQDTDPVQAETILYLTAARPARSWRLLEPAPGSLFVVGDPKQSIYRFRRADIDVYEDVRKIVEGAGGETLRLALSFRSAPAICDRVNAVFDERFGRGVPHQPENVPLVAGRSGVGGSLPTGAFGLPIRVAGRKFRPVWDEDARAVARWIASAIGNGRTISLAEDREERVRPVRAGDFLVILRNAGRLDAYARALESAGVRAAVAGGRAYKDSEEVRALLPFLQSIADPDDPVPFVAFLRGPCCGVDDDALYRFKRAGGRFSWRSDPPPDADPRVATAVAQLRRGREWARDLPAGSAVARIVDDLAILPGAYADVVGERRAGNVEKTLTFARSLSARGASFAQIVEALETVVDEGETPEMSIEPVREDAVRVTNLHQAKGLEAPIVFLAGPLSDSGREGRSVWIDRTAVPPLGHFFVRNVSGAEVARPAGWSAMRAIEKEHEAAEKIRLLYVAATRAMNLLVVSGWVDPEARNAKARYGPWKELGGEPLPDLPDVGEAPGPPEARALPPAADRERAEDRLAGIRTAIRRATHAVSSPSRFETGAPFVARERTGRGLSWGRVLHRLLEARMRSADAAGPGSRAELETLAGNLLREEDREAGEREPLLDVVDRVCASEPWRRARAARERLVEVPFAVVVRSKEYGLPDPPAETLLNGAIDLVYREDGVWKLIDYKSDVLTAAVSELAAFYAPQLRAYRDQWAKLTGEETRAGLLFLEAPDQVHWI